MEHQWTGFRVDDKDSVAVLNQLNMLAKEGYNSEPVYVPCTDGGFVFVAKNPQP